MSVYIIEHLAPFLLRIVSGWDACPSGPQNTRTTRMFVAFSALKTYHIRHMSVLSLAHHKRIYYLAASAFSQRRPPPIYLLFVQTQPSSIHVSFPRAPKSTTIDDMFLSVQTNQTTISYSISPWFIKKIYIIALLALSLCLFFSICVFDIWIVCSNNNKKHRYFFLSLPWTLKTHRQQYMFFSFYPSKSTIFQIFSVRFPLFLPPK